MDRKAIYQFYDNVVGDGELISNFISAIRSGDNEILHNAVSQAVMLDGGWILTIESALHSIEQIVRNPRKFIAEEDDIVDVAKARRVSSRTVRHLASHSQYVRNIEEDGDVIPNKLLVSYLDDDLAIYENRFVCALIKRLILFVEQRYRDLDGKMDVSTTTNLSMHSKFNYGDSKFVCDIRLQVQEPPVLTEDVEKNQDLYDRVDNIRKRLRILQNTDFMKFLGGKKIVKPPIQKTNLLMKNVDYNSCYKLWLFISAYTNVGYAIDVKDKSLPVDGDYYDDLTFLAGISLKDMFDRNILSREKYAAIPYVEREQREYKLITNYTFTPDFDNTRETAGPDSINEYYYRRMKGELVKLTSDNEIAIERRLQVNFNKFYRTVSRINDAMYDEMIDEFADESLDKFEKSELSKTRREILNQMERVRRRSMLTKLVWEDLERAQRKEERERAKLEKLKKSYREQRALKNVKTVKHVRMTVTTSEPEGGDDKEGGIE